MDLPLHHGAPPGSILDLVVNTHVSAQDSRLEVQLPLRQVIVVVVIVVVVVVVQAIIIIVVVVVFIIRITRSV